MSKVISSVKISETIGLTECNDGFWLYDKTRGMNLVMRAKTRDDAFIEALTYYQGRLKEVQDKYNILKRKVDGFLTEMGVEADCE